MIIIEMRTNETNINGVAIDLDADRSITVFENGDSLWLDFKNGEMLQGLLISREASDALFYLLGVKLGYIEDQA